MTEPSSGACHRVLHLIDSLGLGGAQSVLQSYFAFRKDDDTIHLFGLRSMPNQTEIDHPNVLVSSSPSRFALGPLFELRRIVSRNRIEILHCHLFRAQVFGLALKLLFFPQIVLVFHEHGRVVGRESESRFEAAAFHGFLRLAAAYVDSFVCISEFTRDSLLLRTGDLGRRVVILYNPVRIVSPPVEFERGAERHRFGVPDNAFVVGFAGRLIERKGWREFLRAIRQVAGCIPVYFLLAGDGSDRESVVECVRDLGLERSGRVLGYVRDMDTLYATLDCFVAPADWEAHGLSHLEAQSSGVPVVVSDVPGLRETVHGEIDALLCRARDIPGLAEQILRIAQHADLRERLSAGGRANASRYSLDRFARELEQVYSDAMSSAIERPVTRRLGLRTGGAPKRSPY